MNSKRLPLPAHVVEHELSNDTSAIDVPAGAHLFRLQQTGDSPDQALTFHLRHPQSQLWVKGTVQAAGESHPSLKIQVMHHAPHTQAETLVRTLATEQAQPRFEGLITVTAGAVGCESYLNHHSLLLDDARSWSWPALEILNNEVKCSHAATMRTITEEDIFYLRSRGLLKNQAITLLVNAFLA